MLIPLGILAASGAGAGSYELIETVTLSSTTASVTFSNLNNYATTYEHLQLRMVARTNRGSGTDDLSIQFNGDTGNNYRWHYLTGNGSSVSSADIGVTSWIGNYQVAGGNFTSSGFSVHVTDILDAFNSSKNTTTRTLAGLAGSSNEIGLTSGAWFNTAAVSSIRVYLRLGTSYVAGSRFSLYGLKAS